MDLYYYFACVGSEEFYSYGQQDDSKYLADKIDALLAQNLL